MRRLVTFALIAAFSSAPALAQTALKTSFEGTYLGAGIGQSKLHDDSFDQLEKFGYSVDNNDTAYQLFMGYQFNPYFAVEGSYIDFGDFSASYSDAYLKPNNELSTDGFGAAMLGRLPIQGGFSIHGKLGMVAWDAESKGGYSYDKSLSADSNSDDGTDPFYGLGAEYASNNITIRGEYVRYDINSDVDIDMLSASLGYRF